MIVSSLRLNRKELFCALKTQIGGEKTFFNFFGKKVVKSGGMW